MAVPRLFNSHSAKDDIEALAFQRWLELKGWSHDDIFIDLHDVRAGVNFADEALLSTRSVRL